MKIKLITGLSKEQCIANLGNAFSKENSEIIGKISDDNITIKRKENYQSGFIPINNHAYIPIFKGKLFRSKQGTLIEGGFKYKPSINYYASLFIAIVVGAIWFILGLISLIFNDNEILPVLTSKLTAIMIPILLWTVIFYTNKLAKADKIFVIDILVNLLNAKQEGLK
ncbi:MAG: hypothetical protein KJ620_06020 [Candidatus Edwardsbacteria bacterium]|nr:hypothetical protein [Candidatus Edwardsbacteria bacterium]MBU1575845.1 hypothetical protein [Candidatus Edwardsbacteria bacterium]MBU2463631.1 hypothetical protein [Candidatus Edwardsbacteria bacterium]MBU2593059.1 hypothetical protein [Candidatus Edwardsbacteria bacterium]